MKKNSSNYSKAMTSERAINQSSLIQKGKGQAWPEGPDVSESVHTAELSPPSHPGILVSYMKGFGIECVFMSQPHLLMLYIGPWSEIAQTRFLALPRLAV